MNDDRDFCVWCLDVAESDHAERCTALDLQLHLLATSAPADPPVATQIEHWLWGQDDHEPGDQPPPF